MNVINLTPHAVTVFAEDDMQHIVFPASGIVARATVINEPVSLPGLDGFAVTRPIFTAPVDLPAYQQGVYLLVSRLTAEAAAVTERTTADLLMVGQLVRDPQDRDRILGCRGFSRL